MTLLTHDSFDVSAKVVNGFERSSGITLKIVPAGDAGQLVNRAILSAGNPEGDVLFGVDDNLLQGAVDAGVFEPYRPGGVGLAWTPASPRTPRVPSCRSITARSV